MRLPICEHFWLHCKSDFRQDTLLKKCIRDVSKCIKQRLKKDILGIIQCLLVNKTFRSVFDTLRQYERIGWIVFCNVTQL
jgi:hypothetical protein